MFILIQTKIKISIKGCREKHPHHRQNQNLHHRQIQNQRLPRETEAATEDCVGNWKNSPLRLKQDNNDEAAYDDDDGGVDDDDHC